VAPPTNLFDFAQAVLNLASNASNIVVFALPEN